MQLGTGHLFVSNCAQLDDIFFVEIALGALLVTTVTVLHVGKVASIDQLSIAWR